MQIASAYGDCPQHEVAASATLKLGCRTPVSAMPSRYAVADVIILSYCFWEVNSTPLPRDPVVLVI